jgi:hypothetical protein
MRSTNRRPVAPPHGRVSDGGQATLRSAASVSASAAAAVVVAGTAPEDDFVGLRLVRWTAASAAAGIAGPTSAGGFGALRLVRPVVASAGAAECPTAADGFVVLRTVRPAVASAGGADGPAPARCLAAGRLVLAVSRGSMGALAGAVSSGGFLAVPRLVRLVLADVVIVSPRRDGPHPDTRGMAHRPRSVAS